jgi:hypothetical protein
MTTELPQERKIAIMVKIFEISEAKNRATGRNEFYGFYKTLPNRTRLPRTFF